MTEEEPRQYARGPERIARIQDLASGITCEQAAEKYGISLQGMKEFSARNASDIRRVREQQNEELAAELHGVWIADRHQKIMWLQQYAENCEAELESTTDSRERRQLRAQAAKLMHQAAEQLGQLPVRGALELNVKGNPFAGFDAVAIDDDGNLHPVK